MQNFTQSMSQEMLDDLKVWAKIRRCNNVQELLRNVIVPDWLAQHEREKRPERVKPLEDMPQNE